MGLFDIGNNDLINQISGTSNPQYQSADLDSGTKGLIQDSIDRAQQPYGNQTDIAKNASQFRGGGQGGLMSSPGTGQAIANKYAQLAGEKVSAMQTQQGLSNTHQEFNRTGLALDNAMKTQQVQNQNYEAYLGQIKNEQKVRAETMNLILGGGAQLGGAAAGNAAGSKGGGGGKPKPKGGGEVAYGESRAPNEYENYES